MIARAKPRKVVVLGAGASRGVSYGNTARYPSPLDSDFFDLLQRRFLGAISPKIRKAINRVFRRMEKLPYEYWRSLERAFYTLHLSAYLADKLGNDHFDDSDESVIEDFAIAIHALLRSAHRDKCCEHHQALFTDLASTDAIITFNYDLVAERALRRYFERKKMDFGPWLYRLNTLNITSRGPLLLKLHGSANWEIRGERLIPRTKAWADFDEEYGYTGYQGEGTSFPIFLPFWDKRIEKRPWIGLWRKAFSKLQAATHVVIWGYSLPATDIKAQQLFLLSLGEASRKPLFLCVIDPAESIRFRWRSLFPRAYFWEYKGVTDFLGHPPNWWSKKPRASR